MNCCNAWGHCDQGRGCPAGARSTHPCAGIVAQKILGTDPLPELMPMGAPLNQQNGGEQVQGLWSRALPYTGHMDDPLDEDGAPLSHAAETLHAVAAMVLGACWAGVVLLLACLAWPPRS